MHLRLRCWTANSKIPILTLSKAPLPSLLCFSISLVLFFRLSVPQQLLFGLRLLALHGRLHGHLLAHASLRFFSLTSSLALSRRSTPIPRPRPRPPPASLDMVVIGLEVDEESNAAKTVGHLHSADSSGTDDMLDELAIPPRIGDEYQAEIPSLLTETERLEQHHRPVHADSTIGDEVYTGSELGIPIVWVSFSKRQIKHEDGVPSSNTNATEAGLMKSRSKKKCQINSKCSKVSRCFSENFSHHVECPHSSDAHVKSCNSTTPLRQKTAGSKGCKCSVRNDQANSDLSLKQQHETKAYIPLPESPSSSWTAAERESFLLGLYIFGKNLVQVQRFMETKRMGDILSYYYGKFYRSDAHRRWSDCKKTRSRKCIRGHRIFTGWRQQEFLSRILPSASKEVANTLLEAAKKFSEGKILLEEYFFALKAAVGMDVLVEAIAIGKGKHDLTGIASDPNRTNQVNPVRPEVPIGKACSALTYGEIIKILTGGFRLSKARTNDLFWEAVWPRLLARGWNSEQPRDLVSGGSKKALVFLAPGVKKFSRRKLMKGNQYFDSITDVLSKVALDPGLIELEAEGAEHIEKTHKTEGDYGLDMDTNLDQIGRSHNQRHSYLRPRLPDCDPEIMKFTVVDTSYVQGESPSRIRKLSLPTEASGWNGLSAHSGKIASHISSKQSDSPDMPMDDLGESGRFISDDKSLVNKGMSAKVLPSIHCDHEIADSKMEFPLTGHRFHAQITDLLNSRPQVKTQCSHKVKSAQPSDLAPVPKRQKSASCGYAGSQKNSHTVSKSNLKKTIKPISKAHYHKVSDTVNSEAVPSQEMFSKSSANSSMESRNHIATGTNGRTIFLNEIRPCQQKPERRTLIDLNLPLPPDFFDADEPSCAPMFNSSEGMSPKHQLNVSEKVQPLGRSETSETHNIELRNKQPAVNARRQSTRNRPPTTRALEAVACGFLGSGSREKGTKAPSYNNSSCRSTRQSSRLAVPPELPPATIHDAVASDTSL